MRRDESVIGVKNEFEGVVMSAHGQGAGWSGCAGGGGGLGGGAAALGAGGAAGSPAMVVVGVSAVVSSVHIFHMKEVMIGTDAVTLVCVRWWWLCAQL